MDLSIIVVNWNTRDLLVDCLDSILNQTHGLRLEVVVIDNASSDDSVLAVRRFPEVQLIPNPRNVGFAQANNQGIRASTGRYVVLLNSDTTVRPGALESLVEFMDGHPRAGAAGPYLLNVDGSLQPSCHPVLSATREFWRLTFLDRLLPRATYPMHRWGQGQPRPVEVIKGACLLLRREALDEVGLLDERYFMYTEEMDLCYRLALGGWELYWVPQAQVVHLGGASTRQVAEEMYVALYRSKVQFQRKFWGSAGARWFKLLMMAAYLPRWVLLSIARLFNGASAPRAHICRRLLLELPRM